MTRLICPSGLVATLIGLALLTGPARTEPAPPPQGRVDIDLGRSGLRNHFIPGQALGAGIDGGGQGDSARLLTTHNARAMRSAGLKPLTYRLRTELGIEAWHWGPEGTWSDPAHAQGYWVSSDHPRHPIMTSWGYALPRRGDTIDQANNVGYSRLTDGDLTTFWKSNPYLDRSYTGEAGFRAQWFIVELGAPTPVNAVEIDWGTPHAIAYEVQAWTGLDEYDPAGRWVTFPGGHVTEGTGGHVHLTFSGQGLKTEFIRVLLEQGSDTAPSGSTDRRDRLGYAVREFAAGWQDDQGRFTDALHHAPSPKRQSIAHVSSTDPWHRAVDRDPELEQAGFDRVFASGLTNGRPMLVPVGVVYDTPENAAAEIRFLKARHYRVKQVELGEEPDGQYMDARDYGALYLETVDALRAVDPKLALGGPSLQSGFSDTWLDPDPDRSWTRHLITYLKARGRLADLEFFSFEHYPFDDICGDLTAKLQQQSLMMDTLVTRLTAEGVPTTIPWIISEYGFSAYSGRAMSEMPSALLMANIVGQFLTLGGDGAYLFGYGPNYAVNQHLACAGYGNMMLHMADPEGQAKTPMPVYWTARMITQDWLVPGDRQHSLYAAQVDADGRGDTHSVKAFAALRPDGRLGLLLVNRDAHRAFDLKLGVKRGTAHAHLGSARLVQYSPEQYVWADRGEDSAPARSEPPRRQTLSGRQDHITLPPYSLTVLVGDLGR